MGKIQVVGMPGTLAVATSTSSELSRPCEHASPLLRPLAPPTHGHPRPRAQRQATPHHRRQRALVTQSGMRNASWFQNRSTIKLTDFYDKLILKPACPFRKRDFVNLAPALLWGSVHSAPSSAACSRSAGLGRMSGGAWMRTSRSAAPATWPAQPSWPSCAARLPRLPKPRCALRFAPRVQGYPRSIHSASTYDARLSRFLQNTARFK